MTTKIDATDKRTALRQLGLWGLLANWEEIHAAPWLESLIAYERAERQRRSPSTLARIDPPLLVRIDPPLT